MMQRALKCCIGGAIALLCLVSAAPAFAAGVDGGVTFTDIALDSSSGIDFERHGSPSRLAARAAIDATSPIPIASFNFPPGSPQKETGLPGVAIFDYDRDGDLDIYATNGPGTANSLYQSQLANGGGLTFVDVAAAAGVEATAQDSTGVCYGDTDNDGDHDMYVVAVDGHAFHFFQNNGNGTFTDATTGDLAGNGTHAVGCSFADVDNDGLLDIFIANTVDDWNTRTYLGGIFYYEGFEHNQLLVNKGGNVFVDESAARGIHQLEGMDGDPTLSWAPAAVDYDQDGDIDLMTADTAGGMSRTGVGYNRLYENDGTGHFTEVGPTRGLTQIGAWMGLSFADYNCDGHLDFFSTNLGRFMGGPTGSSRWFLGSASKSFTDPGVGALASGGLGGTPFGWGTSTIDFDNDGDQDIIWYGDDDIVNLVATDNPGTLLRNDGQCSASFKWESGALRDHRNREVHGVAAGDLNNDGFDDVVTAANFQIDFIIGDPTNPCRSLGANVGKCNIPFATINGFPTPQTVFDGISTAEVVYTIRINPGFFTLVPHTRHLGNMSVEINSADNGNGWAQISVLGTKGLTNGGAVNRDGIGAVLRFTPDGGKTAIHPVLGGASHASQDDLTATLGLGDAAKGTVDILWPGGTVNRLYDVAAGERVRVPEIPCSVTGNWKNFGLYNSCVVTSLNQLRNAGLISDAERERLRASAVRAFNEQ